MKKAMLLMAVLLLFVVSPGCTSGEQVESFDAALENDDSSASSQADGIAAETAEEARYPVHTWSWVDGATGVAIEAGGKISYVGLDNRVKETAEIAPELLGEAYKLIYSDRSILVLRGYSDDSAYTSAYKTNGEWRLYNGSIHKRDGTVVKVFPKLLTNSETNEVTIDGNNVGDSYDETQREVFERAVWINDSYLALVSQRRLFFYETATGRLILVDDFSEEIPAGKAGAYYGIQNVVAQGEGCLYFVYDIMEKGGAEGHLYYGDYNGGRRDVLRGATFGAMFGNDGIAVMQTYTADPATQVTSKTEYIFNNGNQSRGEIPPVNGWAFYHHVYKTETGGRILFEGTPEPEKAETFYVFDIIDGQMGVLSSYAPSIENMRQFSFITARGERGALEYIFSAQSSEAQGSPKSYIYSEKTKNITELEVYIPRMNDDRLYSSATHYIDFIPDPYDTTHIRVREIK